MTHMNGNGTSSNGRKQASGDTLDFHNQKVIEHLEAAFEIVDSQIKSKLKEAGNFLKLNEGHVLNEFYIEGKSHDKIAEEGDDTVRQVYELRESSLQKLAQSTGEGIAQTEARLRLVGWFENHCSPEVIDHLRNS